MSCGVPTELRQADLTDSQYRGKGSIFREQITFQTIDFIQRYLKIEEILDVRPKFSNSDLRGRGGKATV